MDRNKIREDMVQTMLRFRRADVGRQVLDISPGEYKALEMLSRGTEANLEKAPVYVSKMANDLGVSPPAVSRLLKHMEEKGFIGRSADTKDRRNTCVFLTERGIEKREECRRTMAAFMERVIERMEVQNMQELLSLLNQMVDIMEDELKKAEKGDRIC